MLPEPISGCDIVLRERLGGPSGLCLWAAASVSWNAHSNNNLSNSLRVRVLYIKPWNLSENEGHLAPQTSSSYKTSGVIKICVFYWNIFRSIWWIWNEMKGNIISDSVQYRLDPQFMTINPNEATNWSYVKFLLPGLFAVPQRQLLRHCCVTCNLNSFETGVISLQEGRAPPQIVVKCQTLGRKLWTLQKYMVTALSKT